jgi:hypothetical protein
MFYYLAVSINVPNVIMTFVRIYVHAYVTYWNASLLVNAETYYAFATIHLSISIHNVWWDIVMNE